MDVSCLPPIRCKDTRGMERAENQSYPPACCMHCRLTGDETERTTRDERCSGADGKREACLFPVQQQKVNVLPVCVCDVGKRSHADACLLLAHPLSSLACICYFLLHGCCCSPVEFSSMIYICFFPQRLVPRMTTTNA